MIAYHGSNHNFKRFRISNSLKNKESSKLNEGIGVYFTTNINIAKSYGKYLYTMEINDKYFIDFRKKSNCRGYINSIRKYILEKTNIDIRRYMNLESIVEYAHTGKISIWGVTREIELLLDSNESWYELSESKTNKVYSLLRNYSKNMLKAYMFNYQIKDTGVLKSVDENIVRIIRKDIIA